MASRRRRANAPAAPRATFADLPTELLDDAVMARVPCTSLDAMARSSKTNNAVAQRYRAVCAPAELVRLRDAVARRFTVGALMSCARRCKQVAFDAAARAGVALHSLPITSLVPALLANIEVRNDDGDAVFGMYGGAILWWYDAGGVRRTRGYDSPSGATDTIVAARRYAAVNDAGDGALALDDVLRRTPNARLTLRLPWTFAVLAYGWAEVAAILARPPGQHVGVHVTHILQSLDAVRTASITGDVAAAAIVDDAMQAMGAPYACLAWSGVDAVGGLAPTLVMRTPRTETAGTIDSTSMGALLTDVMAMRRMRASSSVGVDALRDAVGAVERHLDVEHDLLTSECTTRSTRWLTSMTSLLGDDADDPRAVATLMRCVYAGVVPDRYRAWRRAAINAGGALNAYLSQLDAANGSVRSSAWVVDALLALYQPQPTAGDALRAQHALLAGSRRRRIRRRHEPTTTR